MKFNIKICIFVILLAGLISYIIGMTSLSAKIHNELQIDNDKFVDYIMSRGKCDIINATILTVYNYQCSKIGCGKCQNRCEPPEIIDVEQYGCITLSIYDGNKVVYHVPTNGCLKDIDKSKISINKNAMDNIGFSLGLIIGTGAWTITFMLYGFYIFIKK